MNDNSLPDLVKVALEAIGPASLGAHTSWNNGQPPPFDLVSVLTDKRDLNFREDALLSLIVGIKSYRDSGTTLLQIPANLEKELTSWLVAARISTLAETTVGLSLLRDNDAISLTVMSPLIEDWKGVSFKSLYYPLVAVVGHPQGQYLSIVERVNQRPFNGTRRFYDDCNRLTKNIIGIWSLMLKHWLIMKQEELPTPLSRLSSMLSLIPLI
jgi:hypothetical protein